ncbi:MAG: hypothetical protein WC849_02570 [Candidatus Paceibacterota bacterium]
MIFTNNSLHLEARPPSEENSNSETRFPSKNSQLSGRATKYATK